MTQQPERPQLRAANADFVTDRLAVGGDIDPFDGGVAAAQVRELLDAGVTHVLDVRLEWDDTELWKLIPGVTYRWDGIDDIGQRVPGEWFDGIADWALVALEDPDARLLTHCHMGINRGPSAGFAVLLALGWDPVAAIEAIRTARPIAGVAYAEDALRWHHARTGASKEVRRRQIRALADWREQHALDVIRIMRGDQI